MAVNDDMLCGAEAIAEYLFGDVGQTHKVYHLAATGGIPTFKMGAIVCLRKSTFLAWVEAQETAGARNTITAKEAEVTEPNTPLRDPVIEGTILSKYVARPKEGERKMFDTFQEAEEYLIKECGGVGDILGEGGGGMGRYTPPKKRSG
jgi:hypothetical protein